METVIYNFTPKIRRETLNGRSYLVAPVTLIVPGVLNGSQGPLYYPHDELSKDSQAWNGMPLVVGHPVDNEGNPVSARTPQILNDKGIGFLFNSTVNGELKAEGWFDEQKLQSLDKRILNSLIQGKPLEVSTGLFTENTPAQQGATFNGQPYDYIARNYKPDHLAILPDEKGACSNEDGCGVNVTNEKLSLLARIGRLLGINVKDDQEPEPLTTENREMANIFNRKKASQWLTANCKCKEKMLADLNDKQVRTLQLNMKRGTRLVLVVNKLGVKKPITVNQEGEAEAAGVDIAALAEFLGIATDPAADPVGFVAELKTKLDEVSAKLGMAEAPAAEEPVASQDEMPMEEEEEEVVAMQEGEEEERKLKDEEETPKPTGNRRSRLTREEQEDLAFARAEKNRRKTAILNQLTGHLQGVQKTAVLNSLRSKTLSELQTLSMILPQQPQEPQPVANWLGAAPVANLTDLGNDDDDDPLPLPTCNFSRA